MPAGRNEAGGVMLRLEAISGGYRDTLVHRGLSLDLEAGKLLAVIGRNGTGKTTLARLITGELPLAGGRILLDGRELSRCPQWERARAGIVSMPQTDMVFDTLTVAENLALSGPVPMGALGERFPRIAERLFQTAGSMSGGERKILGFVRALLAPGKVLVLDEPSEGVQAENIAHMVETLREARARGLACLLFEQNIAMVEALADEVIGLGSGGPAYRAQGAAITRDGMLETLRL